MAIVASIPMQFRDPNPAPAEPHYSPTYTFAAGLTGRVALIPRQVTADISDPTKKYSFELQRRIGINPDKWETFRSAGFEGNAAYDPTSPTWEPIEFSFPADQVAGYTTCIALRVLGVRMRLGCDIDVT
jgi:hypothetical protein